MFTTDRSKRIFFVGGVFILFASTVLMAQEKVPAKDETIMKLIEKTNIVKQISLNARTYIDQVKKMNLSVPENIWAEVEKKIAIDQQIEEVVKKNYREVFTDEDIEAILGILASQQEKTSSLPPQLSTKDAQLLKDYSQVQTKTYQSVEELRQRIYDEALEFLSLKGYNDIQVPQKNSAQDARFPVFRNGKLGFSPSSSVQANLPAMPAKLPNQ